MQKVNILIVEDEAIVAMDLAARLQRLNFNIIGKAATGKAALDIFEREPADLVLMDINLRGEMDGIETTEAINRIRPTPIIYLSAQTDSQTIQRAKQTLPAAYLTKPFDEKNLQIAIELAIHSFAFQKKPDSTPPQYPSKIDGEKLDKVPSADSILRADNAIFIKQNYKFVKFQLDDLLYLQADGIYIDLVTAKTKYALRLTLNQAIEKLNATNVVRVHRSYAVNIKNVEEFNDSEITVGKASIPLGATFKEDFLKHFDFR
jgi:two-component system, response regulator PdtaR